jgi:creatinine amidohydrolase
METRWLYTTSENFPALVEASKGVCVIPMGCVEKHGLHLPLGTDILQASHVAHMASKLEPVCIFPDFTFGDVACNAPVQPNGFMPAGSITLTVETEMLLLEELCEQIARNGFHKILIFNGHGGNNPWLDTFLRKLTNQKHDFVCGKIMMKLQAPHKMAEILLEKGSGAIPELTEEDERLILDYHEMGMKIGHACMGETAQMMGIAPESVRLDRLGIESGLSTHEADYLSEAGIQIMNSGWDINYPNAYSGHDPIGCNERIGKAALRLEAERTAHAFRVFKEDEKLLRWHHEMQKGW